ncbi:MAG: S8 family serine peptidase, partial [Dinghuibacter sp.]|nr:S8 family serine peptidase [Dinghuibacter sp.]
MKYRQYLVIILLLFSGMAGFAQRNSEYFYYYKGEKLYLQPDYSTIAVSIVSPAKPSWLTASLNDGAAAVSVLEEDKARANAVVVDAAAQKKAGTTTWYAEINRKQPYTASEYKEKIQEYKRLNGTVVASPCFITPQGRITGLSGNFYVQLKNKNDIDRLYEQAALLKIEVLGHNRFMPLWFTLSCLPETGLNALEAANRFYETGLFMNSEPELVQHNLLHSADTFFNNQWGLRNTGQHGAAFAGIDIRAEQAWAITTGSTAIRTAIYDEGYELNHPDLTANNVGTGFDANTSGASVVRGSHGTACAGIVGAVQNNNLGISGVAPNSRLISISIGFSTVTYDQLANGLNWAWQNGADVISNSWGGGTPSAIFDAAVTNTLNNGRGGRGTVIVFSSGNGNGAVAYPANSNPRIIAVGAMSPCGQRKSPTSCDGENWWGSDFGAAQDVVAPGVLIPTTDRQGANGYTGTDYTQNFNGTSAACPHVSGVAALVLSVNPNLTVQQVADIIEQSAQKVRPDLYAYNATAGRPNGTWNNEMGYGLVNAHQAVVLAQGGTCPATLTVTAPVVAPNTDNR